jgi:hypothetical protein
LIFLLHHGGCRRPPDAGYRAIIGVATTAQAPVVRRGASRGVEPSAVRRDRRGILRWGRAGGANPRCMELISGSGRCARDGLSLDAVAGRVDEPGRERLPGFGIRSTRNRSTGCRAVRPRRERVDGRWIRRPRAGSGRPASGSNRSPNIDGALAAIWSSRLPSMVGKLIFIVGRVAVSAEVLSKREAVRIKIPVAYDGVPPRKNGQ